MFFSIRPLVGLGRAHLWKLDTGLKYCGNPEYVKLNFSVRLIEGSYVSTSLVGISNEISDGDRELLALVTGTEGVTGGIAGAHVAAYEISAARGNCFERDEVLENLLEQVKPYIEMKYGPVEYKQLPTLRGDIHQIMCQACKKEQEEEIERTMRDFDTLEY